MNYELKNKVALVTGGSRGLGAAISIALANSGAKVAINYHSRTAAARQLQEKIATAGGSAEIFQADVTQEDEVKKLCDAVVERWAAIDILVVNATLIHVHKSIENLVWKDMLDH